MTPVWNTLSILNGSFLLLKIKRVVAYQTKKAIENSEKADIIVKVNKK